MRTLIAVLLSFVFAFTAGAGDVADVTVPIVFRSVIEGIEAPVVTITDAKGRTHKPVAALRKKDVKLGETSLLFREVPVGEMKVTLTGPRWKTVEAKAPLTKPLEARVTSKLVVSWWTPHDLPTLAASQRSCKAERETEKFEAKLLFCGDRARDLNAYISPRDCTAVETRELSTEAMRGELTFEDVTTGVHMLQVSYSSLPTLTRNVEVRSQEANALDMEVRYATFYGRVTRNGEPVEAELFGTVSDAETGRYDAVVLRLSPRPIPFSVRTCDDKLRTMFVPETPPTENAAFDVEIPFNRIVVDVVDAAKGTPVKDALISLAAIMDEKDDVAWFAGGQGKTDEEGRFELESVDATETLKLCAASPDHEQQCAENFVMGETREKQVRLALTPVVKRAGRVVVGGPIEMGQLVWYSRNGIMTELIRELDAEGRFTFKKEHAEGEIVIFFAANQPLFATTHPRVPAGEDLVVRMPAGARRSFTVTLSEDTSEEGAFVALRIGDVVVPINALSWHLARRGLQPSLMPGHSMVVQDILASGPTHVILVPFSMAGRYPRIELPLVPEIGTFPQQELGDRATVTFDEKTPRAKGAPQALPSSR